MIKKIICILFSTFLLIHIHGQRPCDNSIIPASTILKRLTDKPVDIKFNYLVEGCNVNDSIKKRILYLLNWQWTKEEVNQYLENYFMEQESFHNVKEVASDIAKGKDSLYKVAYDSIKNKMKMKEYNQIGRLFGVNGGIVLSAAYLNLKEAKPILYKALNDSAHYNKKEVELALARMGDKALQKKIIESCVYRKDLNGFEWIRYFEDKVARKLIFISSQESIYKLNEWLDTSKVYKPKTGANTLAKVSLNIIIALKYILKNRNFQTMIAHISESDFNRGFLDSKLILACKLWLQKNKGNYNIDKQWCPY